jgi:hypothetical protein
MPYSSISSLSFSSAGLARAQYCLMTNGVPNGHLSNGQDSPLSLYVAVKASGGAIPDPRVVNVTGDNGRFKHQYVFQAEALPTLDYNFGILDMSAYAKFTGTKVDASLAEWNMIGIDTNQNPRQNTMLMLENSDAQDATTSNGGQARFWNVIYPAATIYYTGGAANEAAAHDWNWKGYITRVGKYPWGTSFTTGTNGFTSASGIGVGTVYPLTMHTLIGDGATTTVTLTYTPSSDATGYGIRAINWNTGATVSLTSAVPGTRIVTFASAPAAGVPIVIIYEAIDILAA